MRVILQRVKESRVEVAGQIVGEIQKGLNLLVGITASDTEQEVDWMARKCLELRIFPDQSGKLSQSVQNIKGGLLGSSANSPYMEIVEKGGGPPLTRLLPVRSQNSFMSNL